MSETRGQAKRKEYVQDVGADLRRLQTGASIPTESYSDQPYLVKTDDGAWLLTVTTGSGEEGHVGQHVISMRSDDLGKTWSHPIDVEPSNGPEASYAVLLKTGYGRVYCFYNHNTDNVRAVKADHPPFTTGLCARVDSLGHFVFRYTDDHGRTWSDRRYDVPMRLFEIDKNNADGGKLLYFWNVGKPFTIGSNAYISVHKVGGFGAGFFTSSEGALLMSPNLLTETNPDKIVFVTLPDGEVGLRTPAGGGKIAEEQSYVVASDESIHVVYRTCDGHPAESVSRDGGKTFAAPRYRRFADGRMMKHPRAANFMWKCRNGKYLYWFHNHGGRDYENRNPAWICGGVEYHTPEGICIRWSQPEILLYDDDPLIRISYPDLLEDDGRYFLTETQKDAARTHEIDATLLDGLWAQLEGGLQPVAPEQGDFVFPCLTIRDTHSPDYRSLSTRAGFTLEMDFERGQAGEILFDTSDADYRGITVSVGRKNELVFEMGDGSTGAIWHTDAISPGRHTVGIAVDGGARVIYAVVDGLLNDGGDTRQFGFGRFSPWLTDVNAKPPQVGAGVTNVRFYARALRVSELIGNWMAYHAEQ